MMNSYNSLNDFAAEMAMQQRSLAQSSQLGAYGNSQAQAQIVAKQTEKPEVDIRLLLTEETE